MDKKEKEMEIDLMRLARALWRRAWAIVLAMLLFGSAAFSYTYFLVTPQYQASAMLYVNNSTFSVGSTSVSLSDMSASQSLVDTYLVILKARTTLEEIISKADLHYGYQTLSGMISASAVNSTQIFRVIVTSPDPQEAEKIANTIVEVLPQKISEIVEGSSVRVVDYAVVPSVKSSPSYTNNTAKGILVGIVVSCAIIILLELFDEQIRDEDYLIQTYGLPVLATVPDLLNSNKGSGKDYFSYRNHSSSGKEAKS